MTISSLINQILTYKVKMQIAVYFAWIAWFSVRMTDSRGSPTICRTEASCHWGRWSLPVTIPHVTGTAANCPPIKRKGEEGQDMHP